MYMEIADMTLEQLSKVTSMLSCARMGAYLTTVGGHTFLCAVPDEQRVVWEEAAMADI